MEKHIELLKSEVSDLKANPDIKYQDWDNMMLMEQWGISLRTTANFRKQGLEYYKRGGRVFYTPQARETFKKQIKNK